MSEEEPEIAVDFAATTDEVVPLTTQHEVDPLNSGFLWYTPPMASNKEQRTGGHEWMISGHDMQVLTSTVPPGEAVVTEVGSFLFGSSGIETEVELTLCTQTGGGCSEGWKRICGGESCVKVILKNQGPEEGFVGITPSYPAKVVPIKFGTHIPETTTLIAQGGAYMSNLGNVDVACDLDCSFVTCCCAGFGCCRQTMSGDAESVVFLAAGGTLVYKLLQSQETITVDSRSVVAMEDSVELGVVSNGRFCMCCCGGEGCCSTTLTGPGKVFLQSMNFKKFQEAVQTTVIDDRGGPGGSGGGGE